MYIGWKQKGMHLVVRGNYGSPRLEHLGQWLCEVGSRERNECVGNMALEWKHTPQFYNLWQYKAAGAGAYYAQS